MYPGNDFESLPNNICAENIATNSMKESTQIYNAGVTLYSIIDEIIERKEIDLYYYLLNDLSIVSFSESGLEISSGNNRAYNARLEDLMSDIYGKKIKIISSKNPGMSLKNKLINEFASSKLWADLNISFPGCEILDIVHKNG